MVDAMYAPVVTRFLTYDVKLDHQCAAYCQRLMALPEMVEWVEAAKREPEKIEESIWSFDSRLHSGLPALASCGLRDNRAHDGAGVFNPRSSAIEGRLTAA
jgi:hypothetical protein